MYFLPYFFLFFWIQKSRGGNKKNMGSVMTPHIEINRTNKHRMNEIPDIRLLNELFHLSLVACKNEKAVARLSYTRMDPYS